MGFLQSGRCFATYNEAMSDKVAHAFDLISTTNSSDKLHFFQFDVVSQAWVWMEYTTTFGVWTLVHKSPVPAIEFPACTPALDVFDPAVVASFWSVAFFFTLGCWLLAKNYGLILQAIKRW